MPSLAKNTRSTIIPGMGYRDAAAAIEWLCRAFGFEKHAVYPGESGTIMHAELSFGNGMIMCSSIKDNPYWRYIKQPDEIGGCATQSVNDADAVYRQATAAGAEILVDIKTAGYGGRGFTCRDVEGHIWNFGTYDPWAAK